MMCVAAGHTGLGGFPAACGQPVSLPGEEEGRYQDVRPPVLQRVADLERRRREDEVPLRPEVRTQNSLSVDVRQQLFFKGTVHSHNKNSVIISSPSCRWKVR